MKEPDWKKMYTTLIGCVADALDMLPPDQENELVRYYLAKGMVEAEEVYLRTTEMECDGKPITLEGELEQLRADFC